MRRVALLAAAGYRATGAGPSNAPGLAAGIGAAYNATVAVAPAAGNAAGTGTAYGATVSLTASFGKTTNGASSTSSSADKTVVSSNTATTTGTLSAGYARVWVTGGSANTKVVVYANSGGAPASLLASSDVVTVTATSEALVNYAFTGGNRISITSGTTYWLGVAWQDPGTDSLTYSRDGTSSGRQEIASYAPNPFGTPTAGAGPVDVYVDVVT